MGRAAGPRRTAAIVGIGHTDWPGDWSRVRNDDVPADSTGYAASAFREALADAGIDRDDVDGLICGPTTALERMGELLGINPSWGDQGDAIGSVMKAVQAVEAGLVEVVALVYGNNQRSAGTQYGGPKAMGGGSFLSYVYHAPWGLTSQGALYALMFQRYRHVYGFTEADLGQVAVAQRAFADLNTHAIMRGRPITIEDYLDAPYVCEPLHLYDYCLVNDGGVALIVAEAARAQQISDHPVYVEAMGRADLNTNATSLEPRLTDFYHPAQHRVADKVFSEAGVGPEDIDALQVYDSFSVHIPLALEGYGYCKVGEASRFLQEQGIGPGGGLPTNTGGGHLSESYMQGWNHQVESVRQLRGQAGARQVEDCRYVHYSSDVAGKVASIIYSR